MIGIWRFLYADYYKVKRTPYLWLHICLPLGWSIIYLLYIQGRQATILSLYSGYMEMLGIVLPLLSGIICGMVTMQEEQAGGFQNLFIRSRIKEIGYFSKLLYVWACGSLAIMLAAMLLGAGASFLLKMDQVPYLTFIWGAIYLSIGSGILYMIQLWVSFTFGMGVSILLGGAGTLIAALMITSVGDLIWHYIPWGWGVRMMDSMALLQLGTLTSGMRAYLEHDMQTGWLWMISVTLLMLAIHLIWFRQWEGSKHTE